MLLSILLLSGVMVTVYIISVRCRYHCKTLKYDSDARMDGKTVLITGASSGIGKATAEDLLSRGARVISACRNLTKARTAADEILSSTGVHPKMITIVHLDLIDLQSVRQCAKQILNTEKQLDVLINNAGGAGLEKTTKQGYDCVFGVNYLGPFLLTYLLLDLLKKSAPSRVINVSSLAHLPVRKEPDFSRQSNNDTSSTGVNYPDLTGYHLSKLAQIWQTEVLSEKLYGSNVTANSMNPGFVHSGIWNPQGTVAPKRLLRAFGWLSSMIGRTSKNGSLTVVYMAVDPSLENVSGCYFENVEVSQNINPLVKDKTLAQKMWDVSMEMCGLSKKFE